MSCCIIRAAALGAIALAALGARAEPLPDVCPDPEHPCTGFREHDLSFERKDTGKAAAGERSAPFFAVILKSAERCTLGDADRRAAQAVFPGKKVFVMRFECDADAGNDVSYSGADTSRAFVAVYAGKFRSAAEETLAVAKLAGFGDAGIRRMQVVVAIP